MKPLPHLLSLLGPGLLLLGSQTGCAPGDLPGETSRPVVTVSIPPQRYLVRRIAGDLFEVNVMVGPGESPATYEPRPSQLASLRSSSVYFSIGVPFEQTWLPRFRSVNPELLVVDTLAGIERQPLESAHRHEGRPREAHTLDPHVWLDPALMGRMAATCCDTLKQLHPEGAAALDANLHAFLMELDALDTEIRQKLTASRQTTFMVFHPSWGYFARAYDLKMLAIESEGQEPSAAEVADLIEDGRARGIGVVVVQPEFNTAAAETMARQIGARLERVSPLDEDWPGMMRRMADAVAGNNGGTTR